MEAIKFKSPKQITINPMYVVCVRIEKSKIDDTGCVDIIMNTGEVHSTQPESFDKMMETYEYVVRCIESIK